MKELIELILALAALIGAEARSLRLSWSHAALAVSLSVAGGLLLAGGIGAGVYSIFRLLTDTAGLPVSGAAAISSGILLLVCLLMALIGSRLLR